MAGSQTHVQAQVNMSGKTQATPQQHRRGEGNLLRSLTAGMNSWQNHH